jgi:hypothetical protein
MSERIPALTTAERYRRQASREILRYAIKTGRATRGTACDMARRGGCSGRIEAHHEDYSLPLDVRWVCRRHHLKIDGHKMARFTPKENQRSDEVVTERQNSDCAANTQFPRLCYSTTYENAPSRSRTENLPNTVEPNTPRNTGVVPPMIADFPPKASRIGGISHFESVTKWSRRAGHVALARCPDCGGSLLDGACSECGYSWRVA